MYLLQGKLLKSAQLEIWRKRLLEEIRLKKRSVSKLSREANLIILETKPLTPKRWLFQNRLENTERNLLKDFLFDDESLWMLESAQRDNLCRILEVWIRIHDREIPFRIDPGRIFPVNHAYNKALDEILVAEGYAEVMERNGEKRLYSTKKLERLGKIKTCIKIYDIQEDY